MKIKEEKQMKTGTIVQTNPKRIPKKMNKGLDSVFSNTCLTIITAGSLS